MDPYSTIKQAAKLAAPFTTQSFAQMTGTDENSATNDLSQLMSMGWINSEYDGGTGGMVYRLTDSGHQQATS